jgi:hypothetical protein
LPQLSFIFGLTARARLSVLPPGANGTSIRIGLAGKACAEPVEASCAHAGCVKTAAVATVNSKE